MKFFITGMPHTPIYWLSVLCTTDAVICHPDPSPGLTSIDDLSVLYEASTYKATGISDSALGFYAAEIVEKFHPRTVIIDRDPRETEDEMARAGFSRTNYCDLLHAALSRARNLPGVMWVPIEALQQKRVMQKIFWHLLPGMPFDEARFEMLWRMNIDADPRKAIQAAQQSRTLAGLMRPALAGIASKEEREAIAA